MKVQGLNDRSERGSGRKSDRPCIDERVRHVGLTFLRSLNGKYLKSLDGLTVIDGMDDKPLAVVMGYSHYMDLQRDIMDLESSFDLRWAADRRAIKMWQEAHPGNSHIWPDHADLMVWLMGQLDKNGK